MLVEILIVVIIIIICFMLAGNNEHLRVTPSTSSEKYRYSVSGGPTLTTTVLVLFRFFPFLCRSGCLYVSLYVCASVRNPSQVLKNPFLQGSHRLSDKKNDKNAVIKIR